MRYICYFSVGENFPGNQSLLLWTKSDEKFNKLTPEYL